VPAATGPSTEIINEEAMDNTAFKTCLAIVAALFRAQTNPNCCAKVTEFLEGGI
jgi:hypothetical protein